MGPGLQGDILVLADPTAWPSPTQQSTVAVVPVLLTGVNVSPIAPGSTSQNINLTFVNQTDGSVFTVQVTAYVPGAPPPPAGLDDRHQQPGTPGGPVSRG
jgi:hypothetical protein